jgi:hypothetical protein
MTLLVRLHIKTEFQLNFIGPMPDFNESMRPIVLDDAGNVSATLQPYDCSEIPGGAAHLCNGFTVNLDFRDLGPDVLEPVLDYENPDTQKLLKRITDAAMMVGVRVYDYFRNVLRSWWDDPTSYQYGRQSSTEKEPSRSIFYLSGFGAEWLDSASNWRRLIEVVPEYVGEMRITPINPIHIGEWHSVMDFIEAKKLSTMRDVLMANSWNLWRRREPRIAVIEAVIALEATIERLLAKAILNATANIPNALAIGQRKLDKVIEELGLRLATEVGLTLMMKPLGLDPTDIANALAAVESRNNIIHQAQRRISDRKALEYIMSIDNIVKAIEAWANTPTLSSELPEPTDIVSDDV